MLDCWSHFPEDRPSFTHLRETLTEMNEEPNAYVNFYSVDRVMLPPTNEDIEGKIYHIMTSRSIQARRRRGRGKGGGRAQLKLLVHVS